MHTARVLTQRVGNLLSSDGNLITLDGDQATDGNLATDGDQATDGNLGTGRTLHEVIRATVLALGRGAGASAFRVDFFVRWGCDGGQGCDGSNGSTDHDDDDCNGQSASLYLNEVELGFSAGSAIGWSGAMSKPRPPRFGQKVAEQASDRRHRMPGVWHLGALSLGQSGLFLLT